MAESSESDDELIVYPKGDDEIQDMGDQVNFSAALKNRRLGDALCLSNPAASRKLNAKLSEINKQQRRRKADLYQKQRAFFIQQIFAKGLNPFVKKPEVPESLQEPMSSRETSRVGPRVSFKDLPDSWNKDGDLKLPGLYRSHTIGDIPSRIDGSQYPKGTSPTGNSQRESTWLIAPRRFQHLQTLDQYKQPGANIPGPKVNHMVIHDRKPQLSPIKEGIETVPIPAPPNSKHLSDLKQYPNMLFPKMKVLLKDPKDTRPYGSMPATPSKMSPRDSVTPHRITLPQVVPSTPDEGGRFGPKHVMKMIQNLSTDLPHHLKSTATAQIRDMTNSDKIYEQKARLKNENLPWLRREQSLEDRRWSKLETSLSPAMGEGNVTWRRMSGSWTPCRRY